MKVLVVDVGGSHVKLAIGAGNWSARFESGSGLTPSTLVSGVLDEVAGHEFDVVSLGYPGAVNRDGPAAEPGNLGEGWVGFDFPGAFERPVRIVNDAVMQAVGGYDGGRMLFLGLGTGLGSALVTEQVVVPLELGTLPYGRGETLAERVGHRGLEKHGKLVWRRAVEQVTGALRAAFVADYVMLGGGNAEHLETLPAGARLGGNEDAFAGGFRLWEEVVEPHDRRPPAVWRVVR
ncbi:MAG: ROK family protein [Acidobacteria bacterium]|nr:ROK family protein [Acidobacteriota bacterium]